MGGFATVGRLIDSCYNDGKNYASSFRKVPAQANATGGWVDLSMSPGNPPPNYYASSPLIAATLAASDGVYHGGDVSPSTKHLARWQGVCTSGNGVPLKAIVCDYLLYYPFIDMDSTDEQALNNTVTIPRYTSGDGVQAILVAQGSYIGGQAFTIKYTNQAGVADRVSQSTVTNTHTFTGTIVNASGAAYANGRGPFIGLAEGDTGIRSVQSITFAGSNGGIAALVLVKPLATPELRGVDAASEYCFLSERMCLPRVYDGAYINMIANAPTGSLSGVPIFGEMQFIWS